MMYPHSPSPRQLAVPGIGFPQSISVGPKPPYPEAFRDWSRPRQGCKTDDAPMNSWTASLGFRPRGRGFGLAGELIVVDSGIVVESGPSPSGAKSLRRRTRTPGTPGQRDLILCSGRIYAVPAKRDSGRRNVPLWQSVIANMRWPIIAVVGLVGFLHRHLALADCQDLSSVAIAASSIGSISKS